MISRDTKEIFVGAAAVAALFAAIALMQLRADRPGAGGDGGYRITATFNRLDGVAAGAPVRIGGIAIGRVDSLDLTADYRVRVTMGISQEVTLPIDSSISVETDGLFGARSLRIEPGGDAVVLADGGRIEYTQDPLMVSDLLDLIIGEGRSARAAAAPPSAADGPGLR